MTRADMRAHEQRLARQSVDNAIIQTAKENRQRWKETGIFEEVDPADLPADGTSRFFATVDIVSLGVKAGTFFVAPSFQVSRTLLPASREALRRLQALHNQLLAAGETAKAAAIDLRPVQPREPKEGPREPRAADVM